MSYGTDISGHQGRVDFEVLRDVDRLDFAIMKLSEGRTYVSEPGLANLEACSGILPMGAYHYALPKRWNALAEAENCIRALKQAPPLQITPALDLEENPDGMSWHELTIWCQIWGFAVASACRKWPMLYCSPNWAEDLEPGYGLENYFPWVAHWGASSPRVDGPWRGLPAALWQYDNRGQLAGIEKRALLDRTDDLLRISWSGSIGPMTAIIDPPGAGESRPSGPLPVVTTEPASSIVRATKKPSTWPWIVGGAVALGGLATLTAGGIYLARRLLK